MQYNVGSLKYEYKYLVPMELLPKLRDQVKSFLSQDDNMKFGGSEGYTVRSIYFDTPDYRYFHEKIEGLAIRKKVRFRGYNEFNPKNPVYLEIKRKNGKKLRKNRSIVLFSHLNNFFRTCNCDKYVQRDCGLKHPIEDSKRFLFHIHRYSLLPLVLVIYEREAFYGKFDKQLRITFDKNIRSSINPSITDLYEERNIKYSVPNHFVFEVKFYEIFPSWLSSIIRTMELKLDAFSKFSTCVNEHMAIRNNSRKCKYNFVHTHSCNDISQGEEILIH